LFTATTGGDYICLQQGENGEM